jgi:ATP-binding protein involved in chromosome partitioning
VATDRLEEARVRLEGLLDEGLGRTFGELGLVGSTASRFRGGEVTLRYLAGDARFEERLRARVDEALADLGGIGAKLVPLEPEELDALAAQVVPPALIEAHASRTPLVARSDARTRAIGISSGKGGVGKSSVTANLAVALAAKGLRVGLLDADVYGFSIPRLLGVEEMPRVLGELIVPPVAFGVQVVSLGFFVEEDTPVIWRGPMLHKAIEQFLVDVLWWDLDYLLIDMPPGTGDVALSLQQFLPRSEILVVTTPQPAAHRVAQRSALAARKLNLPVRGVIENMSEFVAPSGERYPLFGSGGGEALAEQLGVGLLGRVPLTMALREGGDTGVPVLAGHPEDPAAVALEALADAVVGLGPTRRYRSDLRIQAKH